MEKWQGRRPASLLVWQKNHRILFLLEDQVTGAAGCLGFGVFLWQYLGSFQPVQVAWHFLPFPQPKKMVDLPGQLQVGLPLYFSNPDRVAGAIGEWGQGITPCRFNKESATAGPGHPAG